MTSDTKIILKHEGLSNHQPWTTRGNCYKQKWRLLGVGCTPLIRQDITRYSNSTTRCEGTHLWCQYQGGWGRRIMTAVKSRLWTCFYIWPICDWLYCVDWAHEGNRTQLGKRKLNKTRTITKPSNYTPDNQMPPVSFLSSNSLTLFSRKYLPNIPAEQPQFTSQSSLHIKKRQPMKTKQQLV